MTYRDKVNEACNVFAITYTAFVSQDQDELDAVMEKNKFHESPLEKVKMATLKILHEVYKQYEDPQEFLDKVDLVCEPARAYADSIVNYYEQTGPQNEVKTPKKRNDVEMER